MPTYFARVRRVLLTVFALNAVVALAKLAAGWRANSLAVTGDGLHSAVDATANLAALFVLKIATQPADEDHPYGHGKHETLAAFILSGVLLLTAFELARAAIGRLFVPELPVISPVTIAVMVGTLAVNVGVVIYERRAGRSLKSDLLLADAAQTHGDVWVTLTVLAGIGLQAAGLPHVDALLALAVAFVIAYVGYGVFREAAPVLTDRVVYRAADVAEVVHGVPGVVSVHDIRSRGGKREAFVQMHLVVDTNDVEEAHRITDEIEARLAQRLGVREALIHVEPEDDRSGPPGTRVEREPPAAPEAARGDAVEKG